MRNIIEVDEKKPEKKKMNKYIIIIWPTRQTTDTIRASGRHYYGDNIISYDDKLPVAAMCLPN